MMKVYYNGYLAEHMLKEGYLNMEKDSIISFFLWETSTIHNNVKIKLV